LGVRTSHTQRDDHQKDDKDKGLVFHFFFFLWFLRSAEERAEENEREEREEADEFAGGQRTAGGGETQMGRQEFRGLCKERGEKKMRR